MYGTHIFRHCYRRRAERITRPGCTSGSDHGSCCRSRGCSFRCSLTHCRHLRCKVWARGRNRFGLVAASRGAGSSASTCRMPRLLPGKRANMREQERDRRLDAPTLSNAGSVMSLGDTQTSFRPRELSRMLLTGHTKDPEQLWRCCSRSTGWGSLLPPTTTCDSNDREFTQKRQCAGSTNSCVRPGARSAVRSP